MGFAIAPGVNSIKYAAPSEVLGGMLELDGAVFVENILRPEQSSNLSSDEETDDQPQ